MEQIINEETNIPEQQPEQENTEKKKSGKKFLIILLILSWGAFGWYYFHSTKQLNDCNSEYNSVSEEREKLLTSLDSLETAYKSLLSNNDSINAELTAKIAEVKNLKNRVWAAKNASKQEIEALKRENGTLQEIAKSYIQKIDSLNQLNQRLVESNKQLMASIDEAQKVDLEKTKQLEELSLKVEKAAVLKASAVISIPMNKKSKPYFKAKKVAKIKTSGIILGNGVVDAGDKVVYVRIIRNDGVILATSTDNTFKYEGEQILYSAKREINYKQEDVSFEIYYDANDDIISGSYKVKLFCEGKEIGETSFILK